MKILTPKEMDERTGASRKCVNCGEAMRHENHSLSNPGHHHHEPLRPVAPPEEPTP